MNQILLPCCLCSEGYLRTVDSETVAPLLFYYLKKFQRTIVYDMPELRTLVGAWREMRETWRRRKDDLSYQYDTPVPGETIAQPEEPDPLSSAIGDIARGVLGLRLSAR